MNLFIFKKQAGSEEPTNKQRKSMPNTKGADLSSQLAKELGFGTFIGNGSYGKVYSGHYANSDAVIKIEPPLVNETNEVANSQKLIALRRKAPDEVKRNLPKIYIAKEVEFKGRIYKIIIMEKLEQIEESLKNLFRGADATSAYYHIESEQDRQEIKLTPNLQIMTDVFKNEAFLKRLTNVFLSYKKPDSSSDIEQKEETEGLLNLKENAPAMISIVGAELTDLLKTNEVSVAGLEDKFISVLDELSKTYLSDEGKAAYDEVSKDDWKYVFEKIMTTSKIPLAAPKRHMDVAEIDVDSNSQEGKLLASLKWLLKNGLAWGDLHEDNVLYRPSSKDIVLIDFGLYADLF